MLLWILAIVLLGSLAVVGYYQGAVRVAFSLVGLLVAAAVALPLGFIFKGFLPIFGLKHPAILAFVAPAIVFVIILILFKVGALAVHKKLDTFYKYHESDTRRLLFERLNQRVGICLGLANATVYLYLICIVIASLGYLTVQVATSDEDALSVRWCNRFVAALQKTGMDKAVAPFNPSTEFYFDAIDILANVYHNPLLQSRLSSYPVFLTLAEKKEFKEMGDDLKFQQFWASGPRVGELIRHERMRPLIDDVELYTNVVSMLGGNLKDLKGYVETGKSEKYDDEKILGHWDFDYRAAVALARQKAPNMGSQQLRYVRGILARMAKAKFTATIDNKAVLKIPMTNNLVTTFNGTWKNSEGKYQLHFAESGKKLDAEASVDAQQKLVFYKDNFGLVFEK